MSIDSLRSKERHGNVPKRCCCMSRRRSVKESTIRLLLGLEYTETTSSQSLNQSAMLPLLGDKSINRLIHQSLCLSAQRSLAQPQSRLLSESLHTSLHSTLVYVFSPTIFPLRARAQRTPPALLYTHLQPSYTTTSYHRLPSYAVTRITFPRISHVSYSPPRFPGFTVHQQSRTRISSYHIRLERDKPCRSKLYVRVDGFEWMRNIRARGRYACGTQYGVCGVIERGARGG